MLFRSGRYFDAIAYYMMFSGINRPGEILNAYREDLNFPEDNGAGCLILSIRKPKTGHTGGAKQQSTPFWEPELINACRWLYYHRPPKSKLYPFSRTTLGVRLQQHLQIIGKDLAEEGFSPGCFRAGGATFAFLTGCGISRIRIRGRWTSERTLEHYIQEGNCMLALKNTSEATRRMLPECARVAKYLLLELPSKPVQDFKLRKGEVGKESAVKSWFGDYNLRNLKPAKKIRC